MGHKYCFVSIGTQPGHGPKFRDCPGHSRTLGNYLYVDLWKCTTEIVLACCVPYRYMYTVGFWHCEYTALQISWGMHKHTQVFSQQATPFCITTISVSSAVSQSYLHLISLHLLTQTHVYTTMTLLFKHRLLEQILLSHRFLFVLQSYGILCQMRLCLLIPP